MELTSLVSGMTESEGAHDLRKDSLRKDSHNAKETTRILGTLSPTSPDKDARPE